MKRHGLLKDAAIYSSLTDFRIHVERVKDSPRPSAAKSASESRFQEQVECYKDANESTFLANILPLIVKTERDTKELTHKEFWSDGLVITLSQDFQHGFVPSLHEGHGLPDEIVQKLNTRDGLTNP